MFVKFNDSQALLECTVIPNGHVATLKFPKSVTVDTSGFRLYLDKNGEYDIGGNSYLGFTTVYRNDEETEKYNGYQLSNDGSVYVPEMSVIRFVAGTGGTLSGNAEQTAENYEDLFVPNAVPEENYKFSKWEPEIPTEGEITESKTFTAVFEYVPTIEELQENKVLEMNNAQQEAIQRGVDVTLTDGTVEHFTLTDHDQTSLMGLQTMVLAGQELIPWHTADETEHCKYYSNADMALITSKAMAYVTWAVTYFRDLRIYIRSLQTKEEIEAVFYGMDIPVEYQSEPLKEMIAAQSQ